MSDNRLKRTISSALWSAYADALGFPTELASDTVVQQRLGHSKITRTEPWKRLVGGRFGAKVSLPAGAYSDDTQLRLATSRAIRGNGYFDVEAFAKIELTVWQAYALGAGRGSKAAAAALCNRSNTWFSNFFQGYVNGGGNGAAMRVQPHVWAANDLKQKASYLPDVIRNALCTHGNMRGIAGAVMHAVSLAHAFETGRAPSPEHWIEMAQDIRTIPQHIAGDTDLSTFWVPTWEKTSGLSLKEAVEIVANEWENSSRNVSSMLNNPISSDSAQLYEAIVRSENGLSSAERGSGLKCALFANVAAWICQTSGAQESIQIVANLLNSDTDTIGTMAGAIIGTVYPDARYLGPIQDETYIRDEAERLYEVSQGKNTYSFTYPDMLYWQPPRTMIDILVLKDDRLHMEGLGDVHAIGTPYSSGQKGASWQWFLLPTGQTILSKFRPKLMTSTHKKNDTASTSMDTPDLFDQSATIGQLEPVATPKIELEKINTVPDLRQDPNSAQGISSNNHSSPGQSSVPSDLKIAAAPLKLDLDTLTNEAIKSFDPYVIGQHILLLAEQPNAIELSVAYSAIVVKARSARLRHRNKTN
ncbi:ADP-ribosylglycohydrolase [compost metagenome]